jgi:hypothetical protein
MANLNAQARHLGNATQHRNPRCRDSGAQRQHRSLDRLQDRLHATADHHQHSAAAAGGQAMSEGGRTLLALAGILAAVAAMSGVILGVAHLLSSHNP